MSNFYYGLKIKIKENPEIDYIDPIVEIKVIDGVIKIYNGYYPDSYDYNIDDIENVEFYKEGK